MQNVKVQYLDNYRAVWGPLEYAHDDDAGFDLRAAVSYPIELFPADRMLIPCGIKIALPSSARPTLVSELQIRSRSGLSFKNGVYVLNAPGTVDQGYRGEICALMCHHPVFDECGALDRRKPFIINPGDKIAQGVITWALHVPFETVYHALELGETVRGLNGFGSTGVAA